MENLIINETKHGSYTVLEVEGIINLYSSGEFEKKVYTAIQQGNLVLDMSKVSDISSSGLGILMSAYSDGEENGNEVCILNPSKTVKLAIDSTGFSDIFKIIHSLEELSTNET